MNQTAELVSIKASEIIVKAVLSLRFNDAIQILNGSRGFFNRYRIYFIFLMRDYFTFIISGVNFWFKDTYY